jgi:hypothetical protein
MAQYYDIIRQNKIGQHVLRFGALEGSIGKAHKNDNHGTKLYYD